MEQDLPEVLQLPTPESDPLKPELCRVQQGHRLEATLLPLMLILPPEDLFPLKIQDWQPEISAILKMITTIQEEQELHLPETLVHRLLTEL